MIEKYEAVARAVFVRYSDGTSKLFCVAEFGKGGFNYRVAIENAELIAEIMNKTLPEKE